MEIEKFLEEVFEGFVPENAKSEKLFGALKGLVKKQVFNGSTGTLNGPRINIVSIAKSAKLPRGLISHDSCQLPLTRTLILSVIGKISELSLRAECDFLREENRRLQARLDRFDSQEANKVVAFQRSTAREKVTPRKVWSHNDVRRAANILPISEL